MTGNNKMGYSMLYFDEIDSTNEEAKRQADNGVANRLLIVAGHQTKGKGRRGRSWESPAGGNIFMSLLLRPDFAIESASMVTLVMALSVAQTIREVMQLPAFIKWPNDIVIEKKKVDFNKVQNYNSRTLEDMRTIVYGVRERYISKIFSIRNKRHPSKNFKEVYEKYYITRGSPISRECFNLYARDFWMDVDWGNKTLGELIDTK